MINKYPKRMQKAFTLIEILIALVILAIAMSAVLFALNHEVNSASRLREKTIALMVADNVIARMQLGQTDTAANGDNSQGQVRMLNQNWIWSTELDPESTAQIKRIKVTVKSENKNYPAAVLIGFIHPRASS